MQKGYKYYFFPSLVTLEEKQLHVRKYFSCNSFPYCLLMTVYSFIKKKMKLLNSSFVDYNFHMNSLFVDYNFHMFIVCTFLTYVVYVFSHIHLVCLYDSFFTVLCLYDSFFLFCSTEAYYLPQKHWTASFVTVVLVIIKSSSRKIVSQMN